MSDTMLTDVLRAPVEPTDLIAMVQLIDRAKQAADEIDSLRQQLDQAQADVARLREALTVTCYNMEDWAGYADEYFREKHDLAGDIAAANDALSKTSSDAFIKIKQAEAIERVAKECAIKQATDDSYCYVPALVAEAQRLRGEMGE